MLNLHVRPALNRILNPIASALVRVGITPDAVTILGTLGVVVGATAFYPRGALFGGTVFITGFIFTDLIDGAMARARGTSGKWGAFLDSTLDRVGDGAIFGSLLWWYAAGGNEHVLAGLALFCLVGGTVISYAKARAEGLGMTCDVGLAERAERLLAILITTGLSGLGVPYVAAIGLWGLGIATAITIVQRFVAVHRQAVAAATEPVLGVQQ
ncbi:MAG: CDP-diacylglycerol---glycerol-3-phosphate 3-phosphatidyltransferase [Frankiales bacterium]|jgi:CDP-diacylglycerol--glycerol-3-phosphate 3-phosphatidyltransferase|nr:CDP-diacylglycerol---glycerol-3-phosphate 3-phosphatidyltransferase [Frankiales bacterium]